MRWCVAEGVDVVNLSLSTSNDAWFAPLHELADEAYFPGSLLVCAVNNVRARTYPSEFAAVCSAAVGGGPGSPLLDNPRPPAEFGAPGLDVEVAWHGGRTLRVTGNRFAAAHVSGLAALVRSKHPGLPPAAVKAVLMAACDNRAPAVATLTRAWTSGGRQRPDTDLVGQETDAVRRGPLRWSPSPHTRRT